MPDGHTPDPAADAAPDGAVPERAAGAPPGAAPEQAASGLTGTAALPRQNGELGFAAPWESRVFGMAVALHDDAAYPWDEFRDRLIAEIARADAADEASSYYERWLAAFERLLVERGLLAPAELAARTAALAALPPDADHR
ncbi:MAG TPA: nitrile hydratase accessory protein [Chloroflexota bacterium]|jgi:nitrile hydratase accessory protein